MVREREGEGTRKKARPRRVANDKWKPDNTQQATLFLISTYLWDILCISVCVLWCVGVCVYVCALLNYESICKSFQKSYNKFYFPKCTIRLFMPKSRWTWMTRRGKGKWTPSTGSIPCQRKVPRPCHVCVCVCGCWQLSKLISIVRRLRQVT